MIRARRSLAQNFLLDPNLQRRIVAALDPTADDDVLEIGPGTGALTRHLAGRVRRLVAVELDPRCADALELELGGLAGFRIVRGDILEFDLERQLDDVARLKVVGNIPYNITTPILFWLLERPTRPACIVLMVQKEVADRILADPGGGDYGALTVGVRALADVERLFDVSRGAFHPVPDVDSAVLRIRPHVPPRLTPQEERELRELTRAAFSRRRKQLQKTLRSAPAYGFDHERIARLEAATGLDLERRPETLPPQEFVGLLRAIRALREDREPPGDPALNGDGAR